MNARQLKNAILQQAIEGRLVPQNPDDEPAAVLLERIRAEKARLVAEGKCGKQKPLPPISEEEKPFALPKGWEWVRLGEIGETCIGITYSPAEIAADGIPVLRSNNIFNGKINFDNIVYINKKIPKHLFLNKGDILICARNGSKALVGKSAIIENEGMSFGAFMACYKSPCNLYVHFFLMSPVFRKKLDATTTTTINQLTQQVIKNTLIPLPPLAEQQRIVAKLEELLPEVEAYGQAQEALSALEAALPERLRKSLLQEAVQGRLVPQNPDDEPAAVLLERIRAEKARLVAEGKCRKQKPLPPISEEEKPFALPAGWEWVRLGEVAYNHGQERPKNDFIYIDVSSVNGDMASLKKSLPFIKKDNAPSRARKIVFKNDILYATIRPYLRNICIMDLESEQKIIASTAFCILCCERCVLNYFLLYFLRSNVHINIIKQKMVGVAYPAIAETTLLQTPVPLPPLAEQQRIVAKLEELLPLCDGAGSDVPAA